MAWGIFLKKVEKESITKSFILFFLSQSLLLAVLFVSYFNKEVRTLDEQIFSQMRICSLDLKCEGYKLDFAKKEGLEPYKLYKEEAELHAYFTISASQKNYLKIILNKQAYMSKISKIKKHLVLQFFLVEFVILLLSLVFAFYALSPLRNALRLTEEFIKDILHDFNTPLSTLRLNVAMLKTELKTNSKIERIENSVQNILNLQTNLRAYLDTHPAQKESFELKKLLHERLTLIEPNFKTISFSLELEETLLHTNKDAFTRIIDNLLSNAGKYNKTNGSVVLSFKEDVLSIQDSGKGIQNPKRVFERFYKEQDRGIGIGLHIVKKLCDELGIAISVESVLEEGSTFKLDLSSLTH